MISGYINSKQDFVDIVNGCLSGKVGTLDLFFGNNLISLYVEKSLVKGYKLSEEVYQKNKKSVLFYYLSQFMDTPQAFFTFREQKDSDIVELDEQLPAEELVLQLQLVNSELKLLMEKIITPFANLRVIKNFDQAYTYNGKSVYRILIEAPNLLEEVRKLRKLLNEGYIDIGEFTGLEQPSSSIEIEYILKDVKLEQANIVTVFESLKHSKFSGFSRLLAPNFDTTFYFKRGELIAVYPCNVEVVDFLLNPDKNATLSIVKTADSIIDLLALRHLKDKAVYSLPGSFVEVGKLFMGMGREKISGCLILYTDNGHFYLLYKDGILKGIINESGGTMKLVSSLPNTNIHYVDVIFYKHINNIKHFAYLFLINRLYSILIKHGGGINQSIMSYIASSDLFKHDEGLILYRKDPEHEEDAFNFLNFLLDLSYKILGQGKLEEELENALQPYRDVLKMMDIEEYLRISEA